MNRHKRPFKSHGIRFQLLMCIYPMVHVFFSPHICITTALSYKIPVSEKTSVFYTTTNMSYFSAALTNKQVKYKGRVGRLSLSAVVWLWFNVSSAVDHWMNVVLRKQMDCVMEGLVGMCGELLLSLLIIDQSVIYQDGISKPQQW